MSPQLRARRSERRRRPRKPSRSPQRRGDTGPSRGPAPRGSALRPTSADRRGGGARSSAHGPARSAPRFSASRDPPSSAGESQENTGAVRPQARDIAVPPFPPGTDWIGDDAARGRADLRARPPARPVRRRGAPVERPHPPLRGGLARPLSRPRVDGGGGQLAPLSVHCRPWQARRHAGPAGGGVPGCRRLGLPNLARLRVRGVAVAFPLGPGRGSALVSLRRGGVRGHRGGDPGGAAGPRPGPRAAPARARASPQRRRRGRSSCHPPARSSRAARSPSRGRRAKAVRRWSWTTRRAAPGRRSTGTGC